MGLEFHVCAQVVLITHRLCKHLATPSSQLWSCHNLKAFRYSVHFAPTSSTPPNSSLSKPKSFPISSVQNYSGRGGEGGICNSPPSPIITSCSMQSHTRPPPPIGSDPPMGFWSRNSHMVPDIEDNKCDTPGFPRRGWKLVSNKPKKKKTQLHARVCKVACRSKDTRVPKETEILVKINHGGNCGCVISNSGNHCTFFLHMGAEC